MLPSSKLRAALFRPGTDYLLEAHSALSALLVEESGLAGIWASSLTISAANGCPDNGLLSMAEVLDVLESMRDRVEVPILFDGDTGYGSFSHFQRLVRRLCRRGIAGVCIEDKVFPKSNSFIDSERQTLAPVEEFCGKLRAGQDARTDRDFVIVARTEALITGLGLAEALDRAGRYAEAGADAILVHSKASTVSEIAAFMARWDRRAPILCVPTTYYGTGPEAFEALGVSMVIWANHLLRASVEAMSRTARDLARECSGRTVEESIAPMREIFRLQDAPAFAAVEERYGRAGGLRAIVLAASRGAELGQLTEERPKCMIPVHGEPILVRLVRQLRSEGVRDLSVVRGHAPHAVALEGVQCFDNEAWQCTGEVRSLGAAKTALEGDVLVAYGDLVLRRYILHELLASRHPLTVVVDAAGHRPIAPEDRVVVSAPAPLRYEEREYLLIGAGCSVPADKASGEWVGLLLARGAGTEALVASVDRVLSSPTGEKAGLTEVLSDLVRQGLPVHVLYVRGDWIDVDELLDLDRGQRIA